jgi:hypothetical protein
MRITFKAEHPIFGRGTKKLSLKYQQRSPYFWWWEFIRRNAEYIKCCESGGAGELADLYQDFGDVRSSDFHAWWQIHGVALFAEPAVSLRVRELESVSEWTDDWTKDQVMVVAIPLNLPHREIKKFFNQLLKNRDVRKRGRVPLNHPDASCAKYPLFRNVSVKTLEKQLAVYDAVTEVKQGKAKRTLAKIGQDLKLVPTALTEPNDSVLDANEKRRVMASAVSRYYKEACLIIQHTAQGQFPNSTNRPS